MIYSLVRNSATSGAACPLSAGQWGKRPRYAESVGISKSSSALRNWHTYEYTVWISGFVCVCRSEGGVSNSFKALGCQEQLDPKDSQVSEDPQEYCYGNSHMYPNFYPEPLETLKAACTRM